MKTITTILAAAIMLVATTVNTFATIRYVNNSNPAPAGPATMHYTSIASAIAASSTTVIDTVLVEGSPNSYGDFAIDRRVVVIGAGHNSQSTPALSTTAGNIDFTASAGSLIGFNCNVIYMEQSVSDVTVKRCRMVQYRIMGNLDCSIGLIEGCVITGNQAIYSENNKIRNGIINNNIICGTIDNMHGCCGSAFIVNNVFLDNSNHYSINNNCTFIVVNNNIFTQYPFNSGAGSGIVTNNNIEWGQSQAFPNGAPTNQIGIDPAFVGFASPTGTFSYSANFQVTNPLVMGTGNDGTDPGVYGGLTHQLDYNQNGEPAMPLVRSVQITNPVVPGGAPVIINFSGIVNQ